MVRPRCADTGGYYLVTHNLGGSLLYSVHQEANEKRGRDGRVGHSDCDNDVDGLSIGVVRDIDGMGTAGDHNHVQAVVEGVDQQVRVILDTGYAIGVSYMVGGHHHDSMDAVCGGFPRCDGVHWHLLVCNLCSS